MVPNHFTATISTVLLPLMPVTEQPTVISSRRAIETFPPIIVALVNLDYQLIRIFQEMSEQFPLTIPRLLPLDSCRLFLHLSILV